ncbi:carbohydrate-binding module family 50 protein [Trichoderma asperellum CBS 433.97]|uniref:Carbohydrate-binding module family 50 protein n=2 Tax=Trichoderma asperellum TaxID=101201 RepID=A0A2T3Z7A9_TRIA4|nr:carbohydrate-binding module family 50 protein [Trichoderma asperellum CBS 433.97]PTB40686.1 carbohydrate-binding module family 50 protein [Trichoderma asperellum CBS 433.97]
MRLLLFCQLFFVGIQASKLGVSPPSQRDQVNCQLYTVQPNDSCIGIISNNNITYAQLLSWNPSLNPTCSNLASLNSSSICVSNPKGTFSISSNTNGATIIATTTAPIPSPTLDQTTSRCAKYYQVVDGDDCSHLTAQFAITLKDFLFLNSEVFQNCTNLKSGYYYCVEPVGYISTYPGYLPTATTKPFNQTSATSLPYAGDPWAKFSSNVSVIPIANNTRVDCYSYTYVTNLTENLSADCWNLAMFYDITPEELVLWNPSLGDDSSSGSNVVSDETSRIASAIAVPTTASSLITNPYTYPCTLAANISYCVALVSPTADLPTTTAPPGPHASGEVSNCTTWFAPQAYNTCRDILYIAQLSFADFYQMNPSVGPDCSGLVVGTNYCISTYPNGNDPNEWDGDASIPSASSTGIITPTPIQSGMVSNCNKFYDVHSNDGCSAIASSQNINLSSFYQWNPAVKTDCSGLQASVYVCIGVATTSASITTTSKPPTGVITPTPTQSGMVSNCNKFYDVHSNDGCSAIASSQNINLSSFYQWNPAVKTDCSGLQASVYVCVGTAATTTAPGITTPTPTQSGMVSGCNKFYDVHAGDGCSAIASSQKIALSSLYKWNPAVKTDCSGLQASVYICIGVATANAAAARITG